MKGRVDEARRAIDWLAGDVRDAATEPETAAAPRVTEAAPANSRFSVLELFAAQYRKRTVLAWLIWFGWGFSYFGLVLWLPTLLIQYRGIPQTDVLKFMMSFSVAGIAGRVATLFLVDRWGRKPLIIVCGILAFVAMLMFAQRTNARDLVVWGCVTAIFLDGGFSAIVPYIPELYPTRARGTGVGAAQGMGRVASAISPVVVGFTLRTADVTSVLVLLASGALLTAVATLVLGHETKGSSLSS